jgi:tRNA A-37 threonylcarbamoyl transferase component Bud32
MKSGDTFDRYTILRVIGRGGMGEVYRAQDNRLHRNVALKIVRASAVDASDAKARAAHVDRLFREARAAAALEHPNVVVIHDVGEVTPEGATEPVCFIAMEYVQGTVLRAFVGKRADVPLAERLRWLVDIARALAFAHERGIIHRDVKPDNVILREDGVIKVLDFGIARRSQAALAGTAAAAFLPTLTETGPPMGTPRYMAPEQMLNERLDGRADQYSWALTAYELLGGSPPWSATVDSVQLIAQVLTRAPEPLRARAPHVPEEIARVVDRALARDRSDRFPSMDDVLGALGVPVGPPSSVITVQAQEAPVSDVPTLGAQQSTTRGPFVKGPSRGIAWVLGGLAVAAAAGVLVFRLTRTTPAPAAPVVAPERCASAAQCSERMGEPAVCRKDTGCVKLASEDCHVSAAPGDTANDATVWIGAMYPLSGDDAKGFGTREFQAVELARTDFAHMLAGANARPHGGRPLALLACDDAVDPQRALRHLADDVGVPAVIGFRSSNEAIEAATSTLIPNGVMGVAALNTSPMISSLPRAPGGPRMVWRTTFSAAEMALPIAQIVPGVLEPELRARPGGPGGIGKDEPLRVALLRQDDAAGIGFADVLFRNLRYNGRSALENESSYREFVYLPGGDAPRYDELARNLVAFAPHVVIDFGSVEPFLAVVERVERGWHGGSPPPRYLRAGTLAPGVVAFIGASAERRRRLLGLTSESTTATNARFVARYNEAFSDTVTRTFSPNSSYDAFYLVAYAALALGDAPITGGALSGAVSRLLPPGKPIDVGPSAIFDAINELASGRNIDLNGATGRLDFDVETGDAPVDLAVLCADVDAHGVATSVRESGLMYDATSRSLRGTLHCP